MKRFNNLKKIGFIFLLFYSASSHADTTVTDETGIVVNFSATIIQQSCTLGTIEPVVFEDIRKNTASGFGSKIGYDDTPFSYFSLNVTCAGKTGLNIKLTGTKDDYGNYLALDSCTGNTCASGFAVATYMVTAENATPLTTNLLVPNATSFVPSLIGSVSAGVETTLWFAANLIQTVSSDLESGTYTATGTIQVRYD